MVAAAAAARAERDIDFCDMLQISRLDTKSGIAFAKRWRDSKLKYIDTLLMEDNELPVEKRQEIIESNWGRLSGGYSREQYKKSMKIDMEVFRRIYRGGTGQKAKTQDGTERGSSIRKSGFAHRKLHKKRPHSKQYISPTGD